MVYFRTLTGQTPTRAPHLKLAAETAFPASPSRTRAPVQLRCVAGQEFTRQTGAAQAHDLTDAQAHFGRLGVIDRNGPLGVYPAFERF